MVMIVAQQYECTWCYETVHLILVGMANFMVCIFYHNKKQYGLNDNSMKM